MLDQAIKVVLALHYTCTVETPATTVSEQMLLSIEAQLCTRRECKTFRPRRPSSVAMHKVRVRRCPQ